jgi:hypothetical protein
MKRYFLSYARADAEIALRLANDLIAAGTSVWVDQYDIHPAQHWDRAVEDAVRGCEGMIVVLSPQSTASQNVADEVSVAIDSGKAIIPVLIEACTLPLRMTRMQFIDATRDYDHALRACVRETSGAAAPEAEAKRPVSPVDRAEVDPVAGLALPEEDLRRITQALSRQLGPIAPNLIAREARNAASRDDLCQRLAAHVSSAGDREDFLAAVRTR